MLVVRLTRGYFRSARRLIRPGTTTATKLSTTLNGLAIEPIPCESDARDLLPPVLHCWTRRIPDTAIAVMFDRREDEVFVLALRRWP